MAAEEGGGSSSSATIGTFTKFSAVTPGVPTRIQGSSQEVTYTWDSRSDTITNVGTATTFGPTATADFTFDSNANPTAIAFTSASGTQASFSSSAGDTIGVLNASAGTGAAISKAGDKYALFSRSGYLGWDYQTFGIWVTGAGTGSGTAGAFSLGAKTDGAAIPTTGTATYIGSAGGFYVNYTGTQYFAIANMTAATDFGARTVAFSTTGTQTSLDLINFASNTALNLSGTLSYSSGTNQFSGNVSSTGGGASNAAMTGTATGYFYGPTAQEIGGGFSVKGTGNIGYLGAFGGKR